MRRRWANELLESILTARTALYQRPRDEGNWKHFALVRIYCHRGRLRRDFSKLRQCLFTAILLSMNRLPHTLRGAT